MRVHLLLSQYDSPLYITSPKIKAAYACIKAAKAEAKRLNESTRTNRYSYWVQSISITEALVEKSMKGKP
jgi:hypothetical protein